MPVNVLLSINKVSLLYSVHRPVGRGVRGMRMHPPPRSQKGPPDGIVKDLK